MKRLSSIILSFAIFFTMLAALLNASAPAKAKSMAKNALQTTVEAMQPGWNLGNTFDATGDETSWGNPTTTKALIDEIAAAGFKSIRIPITWQQRLGSSPDYTIDDAFMKRIQEVVDWSLDAGLYVIINIHHDSSWIMNMETQHDDVSNRFNAIWTQVSAHFKDYPVKLMFESVNEPRFSEDWNKDSPKYFEMLDELNTSFFKIVRKSGSQNANRPLVLPTIAASASQNDRLDDLLKTISKLKDKNLIATFHYYGYWQFSVNVAGVTTFNDDVRNDLINTFDRAYNTLAVKGIPVVVGEFGLLGFDKSLGTIEHGEILKFMEFITYYAKEKGFPLMLWDNGQHFNRRTNAWGDEDLYRTILAGMKGRSSTAETDSIYIKKDAEIKDISIPLNLNGNTFATLKNGNKALVNGTDYEISGDVLTIKAGLLKSLVTQTSGINAILNCSFSAGADWKLNIIYYDTPILRSSEGPDSQFNIPTQFNGDHLATIEATYASGGNPGPNDWTPFKEFNFAFSPDYERNLIYLKPEFLNEVKDGEEVVLNMHFWSGTAVQYMFTKQQSRITGVSPLEPIDKESGEQVDDASKKSEPAKPVVAAPLQDVNEAVTDKDRNDRKYYIGSSIALVLLFIGLWGYFRKARR